MLFNSIEFLFFLPIVFLLYWFVFKPLKWQNLLVVIVSYIFYGWWDWRFLILIAITSLCSYLSGIYLEKYEGKRKRQKIISASNIVFNLAILGVFKYYNFFTENIAVLCEGFGYQLDWVTLDIILPVGISFYTFQALSYTIDVYRGQIKATHNIVEFFAFISFFPQLVAGPIEPQTSFHNFRKKGTLTILKLLMDVGRCYGGFSRRWSLQIHVQGLLTRSGHHTQNKLALSFG